VRFRCCTGLRPAEWAAVERRDVDKSRRIVLVRGDEDTQVAARGSAHVGGPSRTRLRPATDRQPLRLHDVTEVPRKQRAGAVRRGELPSKDVGAGDRFSRYRQAREDLRPALDVHLEHAG
jgi:hypothetical protein